MHAVSELSILYRERFETTGIDKRQRVWATLCQSFFNDLVGPGRDILDLACGYGEFINNVSAHSKTAVDLNPDARKYLHGSTRFIEAPATDLSAVEDASIDVTFTSNFLEHLPDKAACSAVFAEVRRVLRPGGRFIVMGPNIRYAGAEYWDYYDHHLPLSHLSLAEGLVLAGFRVTRNIPRFLPFTMVGKTPTNDFLIRAYLKLPFAWNIFGKQFLVVAEK